MQITATLTRFHKIEERLKAKRYEIETQIRHLLSNKAVTIARGMSGAPVDNKRNTETAIELLNKVHNISGVIHSIRAALGKKNAELGISEILAELEQQRYVRKFVSGFKYRGQGLFEREKTLAYNSEEVDNIISTANRTDDAETITLTIKGVHTSYEGEIDKIVEEYDVRINELTDTVSDKNREKITLEIPDEYAGVVGVSNK